MKDSKAAKRWQKIKCSLGIHDWEFNQVLLETQPNDCDVVLGWDQCRCCAKSKLVHLLK